MVTIPPSTGNFIIPWAVDGTVRIADIPGLPIMPLYGDGDLITIKFIQAVVECSLLPTITGRSLWKQCSYSMSADAPPSMYMRWIS
ncbi:hypothetical protein Tco_1397208 [Tanacetum coccineum]